MDLPQLIGQQGPEEWQFSGSFFKFQLVSLCEGLCLSFLYGEFYPLFSG